MRANKRRRGGIWILDGILLLLLIAILTFGTVKGLFPWCKPAAVEEVPAAQAEVVPAEPAEVPEADPIPTLLDSLSTDDKILQLFLVTTEQLEQYPTAASVGGVIFLQNDLQDREQTIGLLQELQDQSTLGYFLSVDEEGGLVARVGGNPAMGTTAFPPMGEIQTVEEARNVGQTIGSELKELGFNLDFAPVADVNSNPNNPVIGTRAFSDNPQTAAQMVAACVKGFGESGMLCTLKHFPGHGDTATDSHYGEAQSNKTLNEMQMCEFVPFRAGMEAGAPFVMVGHITVPQLTDEPVPATLSTTVVTDLLRNRLGFDGIVITDAMNMQAISDQYTSGEAAVKALQAGADIILMPADLQDAVDGVRSAVADGVISEERLNESVLRILQTKQDAGILKTA